MKILVIGSGLIGPAAAYYAMSNPAVTRVTLCDRLPEQLNAARARLAAMPGAEKLATAELDLNNQAAAIELISQHQAVLAALPNTVIGLAIRAAARAQVPLVDLTLPPEAERDELQQVIEANGALYVPGCGVEPGLTEIMARYLAEKLDRVDELHIKCGGIPENPAPPLGYKIVFGGRQLPLREQDGYCVENGRLTGVPRYSGVELTTFATVGECEAWHETFMPWLLELDALQGLKTGTQKTVRWPGYAAKVTVLKELGLLSHTPIEIAGAMVAPKTFLDTLLYPQVRLEEGEPDITVLRVDAIGEKDHQLQQLRIDMVDRYDPLLGFTSMARTTAFTGAAVACMLAAGEITASGWLTPEKVITGSHYEQLVRNLAQNGISFEMTVTLRS